MKLKQHVKFTEIILPLSVWGNPQFSMFSWGANFGFAYNLPTNSTYFQNPPENVLNNFPFLDLFPLRDLSPEDSTTTTTTTTTTEAPTTEAPEMISDSHEMLSFTNPNASQKRFDWDYFLNNNLPPNRMKAPTPTLNSPIYYQRPMSEYSNNALPNVISTNDRVLSNIYPAYYPPKIETKPMMQRRYRRDLFKNIETVLNRWGWAEMSIIGKS